MLSELGPSPEKQPEEGLRGPDKGPPLKLIFLDVDGVICCNGAGRLEVDKLKRISMVVEKTGAKIVLSTDWRRSPPLKERVTRVLAQDVGVSVIGATMQGPVLRPVRPREIVSWLEGYEHERERHQAAQHDAHSEAAGQAGARHDELVPVEGEDGEGAHPLVVVGRQRHLVDKGN